MSPKKKSKVSPSQPRKRRKRRSPEEIIADLQAEIERVKNRKVARELKQSPAHKAALMVVKSVDKALEAAADEGLTPLRHVLADTRKSLGAYLEERGLKLRKANLPKGPRPRGGK